MKRIKIMLLSLTLLSVVGGALAFKAKFGVNTCYTTQYIAGVKTTCPLSKNYTTTDVVAVTYYTTTPSNGFCTYLDAQGIKKGLTCTDTYTSVIAD